MPPSATITALDRMLEPLSDCLNVEAAQRIVELRIGPDIQTRIAELADRSNEGLLTEDEARNTTVTSKVPRFLA